MPEDYVTYRTRICRKCPICDLENEMCNSGLFINPETNDVSISPKNGYVKGCGCHLKWKINNIKSKCPAGKW